MAGMLPMQRPLQPMMARKEKPKKCQQRLIGFEAQNLELFGSPSKSSSTTLPADVDPIPVGLDKLKECKKELPARKLNILIW